MSDLKPCPFCGGEAIMHRDGDRIGCKDLDCAGYIVFATPEEWNLRASDATLSRLSDLVRPLVSCNSTEPITISGEPIPKESPAQ